MAYVVSNLKRTHGRRTQIITASVTVSGSYTQGTGELMSATDFGITALHQVMNGGAQGTFGGYVPVAQPVSPSTGDFATFNLLFLFGNYAGSNGPLIEIPTAAYPAGLSAATYYITVIGR